jgi:hypothetical protein
LVGKEQKRVKKDPRDQQKKESQARAVRFLVIAIQMRQHRYRCHERDQVKEQRWVSDGIIWDFGVPQESIVHVKPLVQRPESITDGNKHPKNATTLRSLFCVQDCESGRQKK